MSNFIKDEDTDFEDFLEEDEEERDHDVWVRRFEMKLDYLRDDMTEWRARLSEQKK